MSESLPSAEKDAGRLTEIRLPFSVANDAATGLNHGRDHIVVPVEYDASLATLAERRVNPYGPCPIVLREWNEQVLLHEVLHVLLDGKVPTGPDDPHGHKTVALVEVALHEAGWRFRPHDRCICSIEWHDQCPVHGEESSHV